MEVKYQFPREFKFEFPRELKLQPSKSMYKTMNKKQIF